MCCTCHSGRSNELTYPSEVWVHCKRLRWIWGGDILKKKRKTCVVEILWPTYYKPTTFKHDKTQLFCDVKSSASVFSRYFCAIAIHWIINHKQCHFLFHVHAFSRLVYNFTQHSGSNWLKGNLCLLCLFLFLFQASNLSCALRHFPSLPHLSHTRLLSLQLSIPNKVTSLWQEMLAWFIGCTVFFWCISDLHLLLETFSTFSSPSHVLFGTGSALKKRGV